MKFLVLGASAVLGAAVVAIAQPHADATRRARAEDKTLVFAPNGPMIRATSLDQHEPTADVLWIRSVLVFGDHWKRDPDPTWIAWLRGTILAVVDLDPTWRSPYFYGGSLLRVLGDIDGADAVFSRGADALPDDGYFAFSVAMDHYIYREDPTLAAEWMERAATAPKGGRWYAAAAAALRSHGGDRDGAIAYLEAQRNAAPSEPELADIDTQLGRLYHDRLAEGFLPACEAYRELHGHPPPDPESLFSWARTPVPPNPRGDAWQIGNDGCVRSVGAEESRLRKLRKAERSFLK